jgi:hypothetical protein
VKINVQITGIREAMTQVGVIGEAARYFADNPVSIGPSVHYGIYQEVRVGYMAQAAAEVTPAIPAVLSTALLLGAAGMASALDKLARDIQARGMAKAPVLTGALRASIGVYPGATISTSGRGGTPSGRMRNLPRRRTSRRSR